MLKILHVIPVFEPAFLYGGPVSSVAALCRDMVSEGQDVTVFTTNANGKEVLDVPTDRFCDVSGVRVRYFPRNRGIGIASRALVRGCRENMQKYDVLTLSGMWQPTAIAACRAAQKAGVPYVVFVDGGFNPWAWRYKRWKKAIYWMLFEKRNFAKSAAIRFTAEQERENAIRLMPRSCSSFIVPNGIDPSKFTINEAEARDFRARIGVPVAGRLVGYVGRIHPVKGLDLLLKAFALVSVGDRPPHLALIGPEEAGESRKLRTLAGDLGILPRVHFVPLVSGRELVAAYAAEDVFALPSHGENFGMSAVEAMACGVPVIISEHVDIAREIVAAGAGIELQRDVDLWRKTLTELLVNAEWRCAMGKKARETALRLYDSKHVARLMIRALEDTLTGRRSPECSWKGPSV